MSIPPLSNVLPHPIERLTPSASSGFDVRRIREDFPILRQKIHGKPLVYLDNAATTQKPQVVLDAIASYYTGINANVHRGVHELSARATDAYEAARERIRHYFNAASVREIIYTRNATEGINLVAFTFAFANDIIRRVKIDKLRQRLERLLLEVSHLPRLTETEDE